MNVSVPRQPLPTDGKPDPNPCPVCGKTGHYFYDTLQHIDDLLDEVQ
jgi:hypothetical protein